MGYQWCYSAGSLWVPFDNSTQGAIENLWRQSSAAWIYVATFRGQAYVNGPGLYIHYGGNNYTIFRNGS